MRTNSNSKKNQQVNEKYVYNTQVELNADATLREIKGMISGTKRYDRAPGRNYLRSNCELVAASTSAGCRMEVYSNGYIIYQTECDVAVIYLDYIGSARYEGDPVIGISTQNIDLMDYDWKIAVLISAENRLEKRVKRENAENLVSIDESGDVDKGTGEVIGLEVDAGIDIEGETLLKETKEELMALLSPRQRECAEMYYGLGMTQQEIAETLGVSQQNIDLALRGTRKKVRKFLKNFD